jgi:hypothetical protein
MSLVAALLASCERRPEPPPAAPAVQLVERPGPVRWNPAAETFELAGAPLRTAKLWTFDGSTDGFTGMGSQVTPAPGQGLAVTVADPTLRSPRGLQVPGAQFPLVIVRLSRVGAGEAWDAALYYSTTLHGEAIDWFGKPLDKTPPKVGETVTLVYDMSRQANGAPDWLESVVDQIRLDIEDRPGGRFLIHQIAIAENPNPAAFAPPDAPKPAPAAEPPPTPRPKL